MSASNFLESQLITAVLANGSYTGPEDLYVALYSTAPTDSSAGTELSGDGYSRQTVTFDITGSVATNDADVEFGAATADWAAARAWAIVDAATSGNILFYRNFTTSQAVRSSKTLLFKTGNITIEFD